MSDQDLKATIQAMADVSEEFASSQEKALAFLVEAGIATSSGELTEQYRQNA